MKAYYIFHLYSKTFHNQTFSLVKYADLKPSDIRAGADLNSENTFFSTLLRIGFVVQLQCLPGWL